MTKNGPIIILSMALLIGLLVIPIDALNLQKEKVNKKQAMNPDIAYVQCRKEADSIYGNCRTLMIQHVEGIKVSNELQKLYKLIPENMKCTYLWMQKKGKCQKDRQNAEQD